MPSAHGPIFCRKELREKVGVKVRFFLGLSQHRRPYFLSQAASRKNRTDFFSDQKSAHTDRFLSELLYVTIAGVGPLLDDVTPIFIGLKSAHTDRFFVGSSSEKSSERFYIGAKVSAHEAIFIQIFWSTTENRSVCAGHYIPCV